MDWFQFVSSLVNALAWPLVVLIVFFRLWHYLPIIAPFVRRVAFGEVGVTFGREVEAVAVASAALASGSTEGSPAGPDQRADQPVLPGDASPASPPEARVSAAEWQSTPETWDDAVYKSVAATDKQILLSAAYGSGRHAVDMAWSWVQRNLKQLLGMPAGETLEFSTDLLSKLEGSGYFTDAQIDVLIDLFHLFERATKERRRVSQDEAIKYIHAAHNLTDSLRTPVAMRK